MGFQQSLKMVILKDGITEYVQFKTADFFARGMGMPYEIIEESDIGYCLANGTCIGGLYGMLYSGRADIGMYPTQTRILDSYSTGYSYPLQLKGLSFVTRRAQITPGVSSVLRPFSLEVWLALMLSSLVMMLILCVLLRKKCKMSKTLENIVTSLVGQTVTLKHGSEKLLVFPWLLGVTFLICCYFSVLLSALIVPRIYLVQDRTQLSNGVKNGHYRVMSNIHYLMRDFLESEGESLRIIGNSSLNYPRFNAYDFLTTMDSDIALVESMDLLSFLKDDYCVSDDHLSFTMWSAIVWKTFCCREKLTRVILRSYAAGLLEKQVKDSNYLYHKPMIRFIQSRNSTQVERPLTLSDLSGAFAILIAGHCIGFLSLIVEKIVKRYEGRQSSSNSENELITSRKVIKRSSNRISNSLRNNEIKLQNFNLD